MTSIEPRPVGEDGVNADWLSKHHRIALQARAIGLSQELRDNLLKAVDATENWRREAAEIRCGEVFRSLSAIMNELRLEGE